MDHITEKSNRVSYIYFIILLTEDKCSLHHIKQEIKKLSMQWQSLYLHASKNANNICREYAGLRFGWFRSWRHFQENWWKILVLSRQFTNAQILVFNYICACLLGLKSSPILSPSSYHLFTNRKKSHGGESIYRIDHSV